jgi:hypothetical protein
MHKCGLLHPQLHLDLKGQHAVVIKPQFALVPNCCAGVVHSADFAASTTSFRLLPPLLLLFFMSMLRFLGSDLRVECVDAVPRNFLSIRVQWMTD